MKYILKKINIVIRNGVGVILFLLSLSDKNRINVIPKKSWLNETEIPQVMIAVCRENK